MLTSAEDRFFTKMAPFQDPEECWLWDGTRDAYGYGVFYDGRLQKAHRWCWEFFLGEIPAGLVLDHLCRVKNCVNPWHLDPVSQRVNMARAVKSHCRRGHARTPDNLNKAGACKQCGVDYREEHKEKFLVFERARRAKLRRACGEVVE